MIVIGSKKPDHEEVYNQLRSKQLIIKRKVHLEDPSEFSRFM